MSTDRPTTLASRRPKILVSGLVFRILFALAVGLLVVMAFFATNALSH